MTCPNRGWNYFSKIIVTIFYTMMLTLVSVSCVGLINIVVAGCWPAIPFVLLLKLWIIHLGYEYVGELHKIDEEFPLYITDEEICDLL